MLPIAPLNRLPNGGKPQNIKTSSTLAVTNQHYSKFYIGKYPIQY